MQDHITEKGCQFKITYIQKKKDLKQKKPFIFFILDLVLALPLADSKEGALPLCGYSNTVILSSVLDVAVGSPQSAVALQVFHIQPSSSLWRQVSIKHLSLGGL